MLVHVDLEKGIIHKENINPIWISSYLGGRGLAVRLLQHFEVSLSNPGDLIIFCPGILTGTGVPSSGRWAAAARSPVTGLASAGNAGGMFGARLAWCGVKALVITGKAKTTVKIVVYPDGEVSIEPGDDIKGLDTYSTHIKLSEQFGREQTSCVCCGPAGEKGILIANLISDMYRAVGRGGLGAVMGKMNVKAVTAIANEPESSKAMKTACEVTDFNKSFSEEEYFKSHSRWSTMNALKRYETMGGAMAKNGTIGSFPQVEKMTGEKFESEYKTSSSACYGCPMPCGNTYALKDGSTGGVASASCVKEFGARCGCDDLEAALKCHALADLYGLDEISLGGVISFAMECAEHGYIDAPRFGDTQGMIQLIKDIANNTGLGSVLGKGTKNAALEIGNDSIHFALNVKGLEVPATDPRVYASWGLGYAVSSRGGCHMRAYCNSEMGKNLTSEEMKMIAGTDEIGIPGTTKGRGKEVAFFENIRAITDCLGLCKFVIRSQNAFPSEQNKWLELAGIHIPQDELMKVGKRIINLERIMNIQGGMSPADDTLPGRFTEDPVNGGAAAGRVCAIDGMVDDYYLARGWDKKSGLPSPYDVDTYPN